MERVKLGRRVGGGEDRRGGMLKARKRCGRGEYKVGCMRSRLEKDILSDDG